MRSSNSILSVVPVEELSVSKFVFDTVLLLSLLSFAPKMLGALFAAMTVSFIDDLFHGKFRDVKPVTAKLICALDTLMGLTLTIGLVGDYSYVTGAGFALYALAYGIRCVMSYKTSALLFTFHMIYAGLGAWISVTFFANQLLLKIPFVF